MTYRVSRRYRWQLRFWCFVGIAMLGVLAFAPNPCNEQFPYRLVVTAGIAVAALYLAWQDYSLSYTIETSTDAIRFRIPRRAPRVVAWNEIRRIVNRARFGFLYLATADGTNLVIDHHVVGSQDLVGEIVAYTGLEVSEQ